MFDTSELHINSSLDTFSNPVNPTGNNSVNSLLPDLTGFGSKQLLMLAGEIIIDSWQYQTNQNQALVYAAGSIFNQEFVTNAQVAFGKDFDIGKAEALGADVLGGNYGVLPDVQFLFNSEMNGALGAYAKSTNTIYFNSDFLTQNADDPTAVGKVLVEETGHFLDAYASAIDSPGDEGEILAGLVMGKIFNQTELLTLKAEDDSSVFTINEKSISVELASSQKLKDDFNKDGASDILWRKNDGTAMTYWNMGVSSPVSVNLGATDPNWSVVGTGDFNKDGAADILWRKNDGTAMTYWNMGASSPISVNLGATDPNWSVIGTRKLALSPSGLMTTSTNLTKLINGQLNGTYIDVDGAYGSQCWDLVAYATGINGSSSYWNANNWKAGANVMTNGNIAVGTAIATFLGPNGSYYSSSGNHTAIFAGYGSENGVSGFYVWDQNWNLNGNLAIKKHFVANNKSGTSDADNYYLIRV